jgi:dephospho-CoA kinase
MSFFLITGLPGSGKSTVYAELKARGHGAYDGDYDHLAKWYDDTTGQPIREGHYHEHERTPEFLQAHSRNISAQIVKNLASKAKSKPVFLCADPENEDELVHLFTKVFALVLNEDTRQHRLATRTNNQWGKRPHELAYDLAIKPQAYDRYKRFSYDLIDAEQPTSVIVNYILAQTNA